MGIALVNQSIIMFVQTQQLWMWHQAYQHHEQLPMAFGGRWPSWNSDLVVDVAPGLPAPRAAPDGLRRPLALVELRPCCGCGTRPTSTTSSSRWPSAAAGPRGTPTLTTAPGKLKEVFGVIVNLLL